MIFFPSKSQNSLFFPLSFFKVMLLYPGVHKCICQLAGEKYILDAGKLGKAFSPPPPFIPAPKAGVEQEGFS